MKVLFEEYGYRTESIENVLGDFLCKHSLNPVLPS